MSQIAHASSGWLSILHVRFRYRLSGCARARDRDAIMAPSRHVGHIMAHRGRVPEEGANEISLDAHQKAADYTCAKMRLAMAGVAVDAAILLALTFAAVCSCSTRLAQSAPRRSRTRASRCSRWSARYDAGSTSVRALPHFVIEQRYGFNKMTLGTWFLVSARACCSRCCSACRAARLPVADGEGRRILCSTPGLTWVAFTCSWWRSTRRGLRLCSTSSRRCGPRAHGARGAADGALRLQGEGADGNVRLAPQFPRQCLLYRLREFKRSVLRHAARAPESGEVRRCWRTSWAISSGAPS